MLTDKRLQGSLNNRLKSWMWITGFAILGAYVLLRIWLISRADLYPDFVAFYEGGRAILQGHSPYLISSVGSVFQQPLWFAVLLSALGALPESAASVFWLIANILLLILASVLAARGLPQGFSGRALCACFLLLTLLSLDCLRVGQIGIVLVCASLVGAEGIRTGRYGWIVGALPILLLKPHLTWPIIALLLWNTRSHWKVLIAALAFSVLLFVALPILMPVEGTLPSSMVQLLNSTANIIWNGGGYFPTGVILGAPPPPWFSTTLFGLMEVWFKLHGPLVIVIWTLLAALGLISLLSLRSSEIHQGVAAAWLIGLLLTPYAFSYDYPGGAVPLIWLAFSSQWFRPRWVTIWISLSLLFVVAGGVEMYLFTLFLFVAWLWLTWQTRWRFGRITSDMI